MSKNALWQSCTESMPLIAILRGISTDEVIAVGHCLVDTGFTVIEVPLNSPDALRSIELLAREFGEKTIIGAGTVLTAQQATEAIDAGSQVVIAPNFNPQVAKQTIKRDKLYCPGVATPTEAFDAIDHGAHALKLFPAELITPVVVKAMRAVLPKDTELFAVGGITVDNMEAYRKAGVNGFGIGSALYKPGMGVTEVRKSAEAFIAASGS